MKDVLESAYGKCGIYCIKNITNDKKYIGSSINIGNRWYSHINLLKNNKHHSSKLQNDWNESRLDFEFEIIEECNESDLLEIEQNYIDKFKCCDMGYNSKNTHSTNNNDDKMQIQLKIDGNKDQIIFNILEKCNNKSDFIKNAIFYYIHEIQNKGVIDRNYPR